MPFPSFSFNLNVIFGVCKNDFQVDKKNQISKSEKIETCLPLANTVCNIKLYIFSTKTIKQELPWVTWPSEPRASEVEYSWFSSGLEELRVCCAAITQPGGEAGIVSFLTSPPLCLSHLSARFLGKLLLPPVEVLLYGMIFSPK